MYATYNDYLALYPEIPETDFNRLGYDASKEIDYQTTGVDGVFKLKYFFPTDTDDAEAVKRCCCALVNALYSVEQIQASAGVVQREDGVFVGRGVASLHSGSESITYASGSTASTYTKAASDDVARMKMVDSIVRRYFVNVKDSNGVNLLYLGAYPCINGQ